MVNFTLKLKTKAEQYRSVLGKYLPQEYLEEVVELLLIYPVVFKIVRPRKTKLGDFRAGMRGEKHCITVNGNLNPYSFLITTLHEFAHLITYQKHGGRVNPHGQEWKKTYSDLLLPVINRGHLPGDVETALTNSLIKVKASSCSDTNLHRTLIRYDRKKDDHVTLEALDKNSTFALNGKTFVKGKLRRTRYLCTETTTNKQYLVSALAQVSEIKHGK